MQWFLILLVIAFLAVLFFRSQRETDEREVVLPPTEREHEPSQQDEEFAEDSFLRDHFVGRETADDGIPGENLPGEEFAQEITGDFVLDERLASEEFSPEIVPGVFGNLTNIAYTDAAYAEGEYGEELTPISRHKVITKIPLHYGKARTRWANGEREQDWREKELIAMTGMNEKVSTIAVEAELAVGPVMKTASAAGPARVVIIETPTAPGDHTFQIGVPTARPSGHDMPINIELQPTMTALSKDPYWAFVYWVLPANTPEGTWELKVRNLTQQAEYFQRIDPGARRWYLHLNQPDQRFIFELGVRDQSGRFHTVLMSNEILTPTDRPSSVIDNDWLAIEEFYRKKMTLDVHGSPSFILEFGGKIGASENLVH